MRAEGYDSASSISTRGLNAQAGRTGRSIGRRVPAARGTSDRAETGDATADQPIRYRQALTTHEPADHILCPSESSSSTLSGEVAGLEQRSMR